MFDVNLNTCVLILILCVSVGRGGDGERQQHERACDSVEPVLLSAPCMVIHAALLRPPPAAFLSYTNHHSAAPRPVYEKIDALFY